jgi:uncharacterized protein (TIGR03067 family)
VNVRLMAFSVIALIPVAAAPAQDGAVKKELGAMAGSWQLVRGEENGEPAPEYVVKHLKCVIKGDQLTFEGIEPLTDKASKLSIKIDTSTTPKCIDLKVEAGDLKGDVLEGVYEWKGDELKFCLYFGKGNRPLEFETKAGSNRVLFVLKREKP